ncbi:DUF3892 domain-containing protein [Oenococcus oeni]|uniref:DUF3892 domain-containing protein n=1 Tax=Oenococcus oeni TaxID=1247 RepID=UPI0004D8D331|nr:DUF3892 domain-containing protein [Oenococcus oeni]KEK03023.1 hypothetical protein HL43_06160 [Oenococcus oeni]KER93345.1 hypothetical protein HR58_03275 [Oenococcus oeni]KER95670.1 hypothetical protein HT63_06125 [Oenococcus oeni]OIL69392.1 hypothetical protein ATX30_04280 [Oenococcus oeni]OIM48232.1 hypothetical protein ATX76_04325 [Oenococcus oeni]
MAKKKAKFKREIVAVKLFVDTKGNKRVVAVKLASPRVTKDYRISYLESVYEIADEIKNNVGYFYIDPSKQKKANKVKVVTKKNPKKSYIVTKDSNSENDNLLKLPHFQ